METLLIATDFSDASQNASFYGVKLAELMGAKVVLLNVYPAALPYATSGGVVTAQDLAEHSTRNLNKEVQWLDLKGAVDIEICSVPGNAAEVIPLVAKKIHASWIIAGMKGSSKIERKLFGGTALSLSRHSTIPLILVPEFAWFKAPRAIALASDISHETDMHIFSPLKAFGEKFSTKLFIVRVIKKGMDEVIERMLRPLRVHYHISELHPSFRFLNDNDVAHAMNEFVKENEIDMAVMISQEHTLIERIFVKSNIEEMVLKTQVPLMVLPGKLAATETPQSTKSVDCCNACRNCSKVHESTPAVKLPL